MPDTTSPISRLLVTFAAFTIIVAGLKMADTLIVPFILAVFIAMVVAPLVTWLRARGMPNGLAIFLVVVLMLSIGFLLGAIVGSALGNFRQDLPEYSSKLGALSSGLQQWLSARGIAVSAEQWQNSFDPGALMALVANMLASFGNVMTRRHDDSVNGDFYSCRKYRLCRKVDPSTRPQWFQSMAANLYRQRQQLHGDQDGD